MAKLQATSGALPAFKFRVEFPDIGDVGFNQVSGLSQETEEIMYRTGQEETRQHKLRGLTTFGDVTLQQGLLRDGQMMKEALDTFSIANGQSANAENYVFGEVKIVQQDQSGKDICQWILESAWLSSFELDNYDSNTSALQFLSLTLKHEGIRFEKLV
jgi:phage tail-like protein